MNPTWKKSKRFPSNEFSRQNREKSLVTCYDADAKENQTALLKKGYKICANYETLFSDTRPRNVLKIKPDKLSNTVDDDKVNPQAMEDIKQLMEVQGSHRTLFYRQPSRKHVSAYSTVLVDMDEVKDGCKKVTFGSESDPSTLEGILKKEKSAVVIKIPVKTEKMANKGTQTDYRESESQTLPWKHEIIANEKVLEQLSSLEWLDIKTNFPPRMEEVMLIEKARQKLAWENVISKMKGKGNESKRKFLVVRMAATENAFREKKIEEMNEERINMSKSQMKETKEKHQEILRERLQRSYSARRMENNFKVDYWNHQLKRKIRKIKMASAKPVFKTKKDIVEIHMDKTSELYAPNIRDGENPSRRHECIDIQCRYLKRFHGLSVLEKYLEKLLQPNISGFNYVTASRPKTTSLCLRKLRGKAIIFPHFENRTESLNLKVPVPHTPTPPSVSGPPPTPRTQRERSDSEENLYQAALFLGKLIKGRALQTQRFEDFFELKNK